MIRLLIVDDHRVVRMGLETLLGSIEDFDVVGSADDGDEAVIQTEKLRPDIVLMDLSMPRVDGIDATRQIVAAYPASKVVVLTSFSDRQRVLDALDAGAAGYLLKDAEPDDLVRGIMAVARGEAPLDPRAAKALLTTRNTPRAGAELTPRERAVLRLLVGGMANKQIARELGISEATVKAHLTSIFQRIGVNDRTQAALWAQRNGID